MQSEDRQAWLLLHRHGRSFRRTHPDRDLRQRTVWLADHKHPGAAEPMAPNNLKALAIARVKRIVDRCLTLILGSM